MLSDVKSVVSTFFTRHAPVKPNDPSSPVNAEKRAEAPAVPQSNTEEENRASHIGVPIRGISSRGSGQGIIYTSGDGRISMHSTPTTEASPRLSPPASPHKRLSRLWSRSRKSTEENVPKPAEPEPAESQVIASQPTEPAATVPVAPESQLTPSSPTTKHTKVPLKDKVKGEFKIISGRVSRDETKVEEGIALKTGHAHSAEPEERH
ncbi:hypothetical protein ACGC1H_004027 [Rhizoctonia solani]|uniref:Uncharacterized protein n=1 Tax=Rhizoctonia solani TaxID=456999 RepID=A0A8H3H4R9_9AGAM|nr:unnamed protein product [Rhizoctonia solani]